MLYESPLSGLPAQSVALMVSVWSAGLADVVDRDTEPAAGATMATPRKSPVVCVSEAWSRKDWRASAAPNAFAEVAENEPATVEPARSRTARPGRWPSEPPRTWTL